MEGILNDLLIIFQKFGWVILLIAVVGIIILGVLKYCNVFKKLDEKYRHYIYMGISLSFSILATIIYMACIHQLDFAYVCAVATIMFALNQTAYALYAVTPLKDLVEKAGDKIKDIIKKSDKIDDATKEKVSDIVDKVEEKIENKK